MRETLQYQYLQNTDPLAANIVLQPICYGESVSGKKGTQDAPQAILEASQQIEYYDEDLEWSPMDFMSVCVSEIVHKYEDISHATALLYKSKGQLFISLGGDHSITPQITKVVLQKPATVVFLDAHADLRESYLGNEFSHATPAHHLLKQGHKLLMIGVRSMSEKEAQCIKEEKNITFFSDRILQKESAREALLQSIKALRGDVYLSIDMDVFNPAYVPSVGTPQAGGIDYYFATDILEALFLQSNAQIKGVDMVELIPESSTVSQTFGAKLLQKIISYWGKSQGF